MAGRPFRRSRIKQGQTPGQARQSMRAMGLWPAWRGSGNHMVRRPIPLGHGAEAWFNEPLTRARKEIAWMRELDAKYAALRAEYPDDPGLPASAPAGEAFRRLTHQSLAVFDKIVSAEIPFDEDHIKLIREQREAAATTIRIGVRVAMELYRGAQLGALNLLLERLKTIDLSVDGEPSQQTKP